MQRGVAERVSRSPLLLVAMIVCSAMGVQGLWILPEQNGSAPVHVLSPRIRFLDPPAPLGYAGTSRQYWDAYTVTAEWVHAQAMSDLSNVSGKVVFVDMPNVRHNEQAARLLKGRGVLAMVTIIGIRSFYPGAGNWVRSGDDPKQEFPIYEITEKQNISMANWYKNQTRGIVVKLSFDKNPFDKTFQVALPIVGIFILVFSGFILIVAVWKQTLLVIHYGFRLSVAQVVLWFNIVGNLLRVIWCAGDAFGSYETTNFMFTQIGLSMSYPFAVGGCLLIALYWHELINRSTKRSTQFLERLRIPFSIFTLAMIVFEIATAVCRGLFLQLKILNVLDGSIYVVVSLAVLIFFLVTRYRLQTIFDKINMQLGATREERLKLATNRILALALAMGIWIVMLALTAQTVLLYTPVGLPVMWFLFFYALQVQCIIQVRLIKAPTWSPFKTLVMQDPFLETSLSLSKRIADGTTSRVDTSSKQVASSVEGGGGYRTPSKSKSSKSKSSKSKSKSSSSSNSSSHSSTHGTVVTSKKEDATLSSDDSLPPPELNSTADS